MPRSALSACTRMAGDGDDERRRHDRLGREDPPVADRQQQFAGEVVGGLLRQLRDNLLVHRPPLQRADRRARRRLLGALRPAAASASGCTAAGPPTVPSVLNAAMRTAGVWLRSSFSTAGATLGMRVARQRGQQLHLRSVGQAGQQRADLPIVSGKNAADTRSMAASCASGSWLASMPITACRRRRGHDAPGHRRPSLRRGQRRVRGDRLVDRQLLVPTLEPGRGFEQRAGDGHLQRARRAAERGAERRRRGFPADPAERDRGRTGQRRLLKQRHERGNRLRRCGARPARRQSRSSSRRS